MMQWNLGEWKKKWNESNMKEDELIFLDLWYFEEVFKYFKWIQNSDEQRHVESKKNLK